MRIESFLLAMTIPVMIFMASCEVKPREINYGEDHCALCDMTVVDKTHAAQYVTRKGKNFVFDSVECLIWKINDENNEDQLAYILVADYNHPGTMIAAQEAFYLISPEIKSPMGANLSAFHSRKIAEEFQQQYGGKIYSWQEIKTEMEKIRQ